MLSVDSQRNTGDLPNDRRALYKRGESVQGSILFSRREAEENSTYDKLTGLSILTSSIATGTKSKGKPRRFMIHSFWRFP